MNHTKEPWCIAEDKCYMNQIVNSNSLCIAKLIEEADAKRIVACVNACKGITTEALEAKVVEKGVNKLWDYFEENSSSLAEYLGAKVWEEE